jgi:hypothetical protein
VNGWSEASSRELARLYVAIVLAPTIELAEPLLWGEGVPHKRLSCWVTRLANRDGLPDRVTLDDFDSVPL